MLRCLQENGCATRNEKLGALAVGTMLLLAVACASDSNSGGGSGGGGGAGSGGGSGDSGQESVAYKLAVVGGDASDEAAFQDVIDCIMASGIQGAETEEKVGDTLYASWQESSQETSLLEWGQILCGG